MSAPKSEFFDFAVDLTQAHAREIILDPPLQLYWQVSGPDARERAAILEEFYTEGRHHRTIHHGPDPKGES